MTSVMPIMKMTQACVKCEWPRYHHDDYTRLALLAILSKPRAPLRQYGLTLVLLFFLPRLYIFSDCLAISRLLSSICYYHSHVIPRFL